MATVAPVVAPAPETVARGLLLRRAAIGSCELSVVVIRGAGARALPVAPAELRIQRIAVAADPPVGDRSLLRAANRGAARAVGTILVIVWAARPGFGPIVPLLRRFREQGDLGLLVGRGGWLAARAALWVAIGGLEESFLTLAGALADLRRKAMALGYGVLPPDGSRIAAFPASAIDRRTLAWRWRSTPRPPTQRGGGTARRDLAIYTAIAGGYDQLRRQPPDAVAGIDLVAFLDEVTARRQAGRNAGWQIQIRPPAAADPVRAAKLYKLLPHRFLPDKQYSLWLDGSVIIVCPFAAERLIDLYLGDADLCVFRHGRRRCIYQEAVLCRTLGLDRPEVIDAQMRRYRREGYPTDAGLAEAAVLLRRHTPAMRAFDEAWWNEIQRGSRRDQLSFDYVARKLGLNYRHFPLSLDTHNGLFVKQPHGLAR